MTRKHYIALADALGIALTYCNSPEEVTAVARAIRYVADACARDNPRFDRERFIARVKAIDTAGRSGTYNDVLANT